MSLADMLRSRNYFFGGGDVPQPGIMNFLSNMRAQAQPQPMPTPTPPLTPQVMPGMVQPPLQPQAARPQPFAPLANLGFQGSNRFSY